MRIVGLLFMAFFLVGCQGIRRLMNGPESSSVPVYICWGQSNMANWLLTYGIPNNAHGFYRVKWQGQDCIFVPSARGGTALSSWKTDEFGLYSQITNTAKTLPEGSKIVALLGYQGESDAYHIEDAQMWGARFTDLMTKLRSDLGINLSVIYCRVSGGETDPVLVGFKEVENQQTKLSLANSTMITTDDLEHLPAPNVHLSSSGYSALDLRLFKEFK